MATSGSISKTHQSTILRCQERIGYQFEDPTLLVEALTHSSIADCRRNSNERLEFLGDSILGFVVCEHLFHASPICSKET